MKKFLMLSFFLCGMIFVANAQDESVKADPANSPSPVVTAGENVSNEAPPVGAEKSHCGGSAKKSCCASKNKDNAGAENKSSSTQAKKDDHPEGSHPEKE